MLMKNYMRMKFKEMKMNEKKMKKQQQLILINEK
jgi:hypothetical protein